MLLGKEDREKFIKYLREEARSAELLAEQAAKLSGPLADATIKRLNLERVAFTFVANRLESVEEVTIGG